MRAADLEQQARKLASAPLQDDPYHSRRRPRKGLVVSLISLLVVGSVAAFIYFDPMHVMPGFYESFQNAAHEMFPSRQLPEDHDAATATPAKPKKKRPSGTLSPLPMIKCLIS